MRFIGSSIGCNTAAATLQADSFRWLFISFFVLFHIYFLDGAISESGFVLST